MSTYDKIKEKIKIKIKSSTRCNWPELSSYCGCCSLSTGIYIRCVFSVVVTAVLLAYSGALLRTLFNTRNELDNGSSTLEDYLAEADVNQNFFLLYDVLLVYFMMWNIFKVIFILCNIWVIYAVYKGKARSLKILLIIGIPCWVFDGLLSTVVAIVMRHAIKLITLFGFLFEGYNFLAINSKYKMLTGKSRMVRNVLEDSRSPSTYFNNTPLRSSGFSTQSQPHCSSCTCNYILQNIRMENYNEHVNETISTQPYRSETSTNIDTGNKDKHNVLNFKDAPIIYNQEQLLNRQHTVIEGTTSDNAKGSNTDTFIERPTTLSLKLTEEIKVKKDLCDTPVIYDEGQLNINGSPIIEER